MWTVGHAVQSITGSGQNKGVARNRVDVVLESVLESFNIATCLELLPRQGDTRLNIELGIITNTRGLLGCEMHTDAEVKRRCTSAFRMGPTSGAVLGKVSKLLPRTKLVEVVTRLSHFTWTSAALHWVPWAELRIPLPPLLPWLR